jgi:hypothetical protein
LSFSAACLAPVWICVQKAWLASTRPPLRRSLNGPNLLRAQLGHRLTMDERSNVSVHTAPLSFGGQAAGGGPSSILRFAEPDLSDIVYLEMTVAWSRLYDDQQDARSALAP